REVTYHIQQETALLIPLAMGASVFSGDANILPKTYRRFLDLAAASKLEEMGTVLAQIRRFHAHGARFSSNAPRSLKMAMRGLKLPGGEGGLRRPYVMPSKEEFDAYMDGLLKLRIPEIDELAKAAGLRIP
ncbi:MAG TPA: hypothetical protein VG894_12700, partial [Bauldia sp.]|nr:hypothetical protein [Bauldia sp.]